MLFSPRIGKYYKDYFITIPNLISSLFKDLNEQLLEHEGSIKKEILSLYKDRKANKTISKDQ